MDATVGNIGSISDPSDWLGTKVPKLFDLESMLSCHICKETLKAPVMTQCGHCFCSLCIRRYLKVNQECPLCHEVQYESNLVKVLLLDSIGKWFISNRSQLLAKLNADDDSVIILQEEKKRPKPQKPVYESRKKPKTAGFGKSVPSREEMVECPICGEFMSAEELQGDHIDICLVGKDNKDEKEEDSKEDREHHESAQKVPEKDIVVTIPKDQDFQVQKAVDMKRLAKLDFASLSTNKVKEKLAQLRLPTSGTRAQLEARYVEYSNLYNSNLDSANPKDSVVLRDKLEQWEALSEIDNNKSNHTEKFNRSAWVKTHGNEFRELIQAAKKTHFSK
ncbi:E3 ubiquitin ligase [Komagataella phaffii CBS 7435]|uniref:Postreplication repair E3 ubiquitin-protein ligase RAD18 n=2 Tax=Komagataella phaffii TaxID=460519 RepID=C4R064_KOMPG|nr:Protein involved in postreplication repair [Komagataella phaffii GS115]AOA62733.1 GQ67_00306T0 [Komagataella phaffii]CAH2448609.1 E3 ubiquitin ligase [Komagataella phaffii CBS 7435]AOA67149.1 GQ68_01083T0 [Komagataella phaffii GS115]CAY68888.1 Protein involved in postreplication repair [Komagataella phaffii GS115]CCA38710.1 E3 ubiquitin ligase [Komagataella phaffii CBS 7435]